MPTPSIYPAQSNTEDKLIPYAGLLAFFILSLVIGSLPVIFITASALGIVACVEAYEFVAPRRELSPEQKDARIQDWLFKELPEAAIKADHGWAADRIMISGLKYPKFAVGVRNRHLTGELSDEEFERCMNVAAGLEEPRANDMITDLGQGPYLFTDGGQADFERKLDLWNAELEFEQELKSAKLAVLGTGASYHYQYEGSIPELDRNKPPYYDYYNKRRYY